MPVATYFLVLWLTVVNSQCVPEKPITFGQYANRAECEAAFTAAYGEGIDTSMKVVHLCVKAGMVMP